MRNDEIIKLRIPTEEKREWAAAARRAGLTLSAWIRTELAKRLEETRG